MSEKKIDHGFFFSVSKITFHVSHRSFIIRWLSFYQPYKKVAVKEIEQYYYFNGDLHRNLRAGCVIGCPEITITFTTIFAGSWSQCCEVNICYFIIVYSL